MADAPPEARRQSGAETAEDVAALSVASAAHDADFKEASSDRREATTTAVERRQGGELADKEGERDDGTGRAFTAPALESVGEELNICVSQSDFSALCPLMHACALVNTYTCVSLQVFLCFMG